MTRESVTLAAMRYQKFLFVARCSVAFALTLAVFVGPVLGRATGSVAPGDVLSGFVRVIDGDTIDIAGTRVRLEGIDAPETGQSCQTADGQSWDCGNVATRALIEMTQGRQVDCYNRGRDRYGRLLGVCFAADVDINASMVRQGFAWAFVKYSKHYVGEEASAQKGLLGIWQGPAVPAWDFRAGRWTAAVPLAPSGCAIKGNVSRAGLIYHMPWSPWYGQVAMRPERGTRWFCSEAEATAAGWRPAMLR